MLGAIESCAQDGGGREEEESGNGAHFSAGDFSRRAVSKPCGEETPPFIHA